MIMRFFLHTHTQTQTLMPHGDGRKCWVTCSAGQFPKCSPVSCGVVQLLLFVVWWSKVERICGRLRRVAVCFVGGGGRCGWCERG